MEPHKWFGASWGAPVCELCDHIETPVGELCLHCQEPILEGHQGITMACVETLYRDSDSVYVSKARAAHIDCFIRKMRPHGPECPHCRGLERASHDPGCNYYTGSGPYCSCSAFERQGR